MSLYTDLSLILVYFSEQTWLLHFFSLMNQLIDISEVLAGTEGTKNGQMLQMTVSSTSFVCLAFGMCLLVCLLTCVHLFVCWFI